MMDGMFGPWPLVCGITIVLQAFVFAALYDTIRKRSK